MTQPWLSIIGIGEDGPDGLSVAACALISQASLVIGGARHLILADTLITGTRQVWPSPIADALPMLRAHSPAPAVVLASGDPFCFGVGPMLAGAFDRQEWQCLPAPSSLSLACARLGWAQNTTEIISFCGRPVAALAALLNPGTRVLALSENANTPARAAELLVAHGFGPSEITLLEALGGPHERIRATTAAHFNLTDANPLNLLAITLKASPTAKIAPLGTGLDDDLFAHDGQITKREIRAATLSALEPKRGGLLWDIGTGSGSIAIEWMRAHPSNRAIAIDRHLERLARAMSNAAQLGVTALTSVQGAAPEALHGLPEPDAIFIGGGAQTQGVLPTAWAALKPGGRMVINAVTIETEAVLFEALRTYGGTLSRLSVERLTDVGTMHGFRPAMTITQWSATRP